MSLFIQVNSDLWFQHSCTSSPSGSSILFTMRSSFSILASWLLITSNNLAFSSAADNPEVCIVCFAAVDDGESACGFGGGGGARFTLFAFRSRETERLLIRSRDTERLLVRARESREADLPFLPTLRLLLSRDSDGLLLSLAEGEDADGLLGDIGAFPDGPRLLPRDLCGFLVSKNSALASNPRVCCGGCCG